MEHIPVLSYDLIEALNTEYPDRYPEITLSDREIWFKAGQRSVVNVLLRILEEQKDDDLTGRHSITL